MQTIDRLLFENNGVLRTSDAVHAGVSRMTLSQLVKKGSLVRIAHGQYIKPSDIPDELYVLQQRSSKIIFSHETALFLHDMAERTPLSHCVTIPSNSKLSPSLSEGCKIYYSKPELFDLGQCTVMSKAGHEVITYDIERTVCDILRSRGRIDSQTLAAAVKNYATRNNQEWNKLREYSEIFHVAKLLRQYLEVLT
jgi:predicted transcriptional regulator of viral defense system